MLLKKCSFKKLFLIQTSKDKFGISSALSILYKDAEEGKDYDIEEMKWMWDVTTIADKRIIVFSSK